MSPTNDKYKSLTYEGANWQPHLKSRQQIKENCSGPAGKTPGVRLKDQGWVCVEQGVLGIDDQSWALCLHFTKKSLKN